MNKASPNTAKVSEADNMPFLTPLEYVEAHLNAHRHTSDPLAPTCSITLRNDAFVRDD